MTTGTLFIISAPSGAGKTSLLRALLDQDPHLRASVSHTTRPRRNGERDGVDYHFVTTEQFQKLVAEGAFLEHARVFDNFYGTSEAGIHQQLEAGTDVVLEIDWQGARQVRERIRDTVSIFILPPSRESLVQRLTGRGQDSAEVIERRTREAREEISHYSEFDYLIINDVFEQALEELQAIVVSRRLRQEPQAKRHREQIKDLLT